MKLGTTNILFLTIVMLGYGAFATIGSARADCPDINRYQSEYDAANQAAQDAKSAMDMAHLQIKSGYGPNKEVVNAKNSNDSAYKDAKRALDSANANFTKATQKDTAAQKIVTQAQKQYDDIEQSCQNGSRLGECQQILVNSMNALQAAQRDAQEADSALQDASQTLTLAQKNIQDTQDAKAQTDKRLMLASQQGADIRNAFEATKIIKSRADTRLNVARTQLTLCKQQSADGVSGHIKMRPKKVPYMGNGQ